MSSMYLSLKVLELLYMLVKYGYYSNSKDINALMPPLIALLNGARDKGSNYFGMVTNCCDNICMVNHTGRKENGLKTIRKTELFST